jgi:hypothetical protein
MRLLYAELRKAATLPAVWIGLAVALLGSIAVTVLNSLAVGRALADGRTGAVSFTSPFDTAFAIMPLGTVGAVVIGVVVFSSEYTANNADAGGGRQVLTTLIATPQRLPVLCAKAGTMLLFVLGIAAVTMPITAGVAHVIIDRPETVGLGEAVLRCLGGTLYWELSGLMAFAITVLLRNGIIPLIVLILNSSVVSVSFLLTKLTALAFWLPDIAGRRLFGDVPTVDGGPGAVPGGIAMTLWALALCGVAGLVFARRDA